MPTRWWFPVMILSAVFLAVHSPGLARSTGDPAARTGAPMLGGVPAELTCSTVGCHLGNPAETDGQLEILGVPGPYVPGDTYDITVRLISTATQANSSRRWGFQLTAARINDGVGAGSFSAPGLQTLSGGNFREYVTHNSGNLKTGVADSVEWSFTWTAPAQEEGLVGFYAAGIAGNGDLFATGDFLYTDAETTSTTTPVERITWGGLKGRGSW